MATKYKKKLHGGGRIPSPYSAGVRGARPRPKPIPGRGVSPSPPGISPVTPDPEQQRPVRSLSYKEGGKVEANNPYGWPSKDARNGGKK